MKEGPARTDERVSVIEGEMKGEIREPMLDSEHTCSRTSGFLIDHISITHPRKPLGNLEKVLGAFGNFLPVRGTACSPSTCVPI